MAKVVVTGGSGKIGSWAVRELASHGHEVLNVDSGVEVSYENRRADLTDFGQTVEALHGAEVVVHLAAIPRPNLDTHAVTFRTNTVSTYNVFSAATMLGARRIVWASSETTFGVPFDTPPAYVPIDEDHPYVTRSSYALAKVLGEQMARHFNELTGVPFVNLRISNVFNQPQYETLPTFQHDPDVRRRNLWSYVDARDVAQACRLAAEADTTGVESFVIAATDTIMPQPTRELLAQCFPDVEIRGELEGNESLESSAKARRVLGYEPRHSWRDHA